MQIEVTRWRSIFHANGSEKKAGVTILIIDKIDFKTKNGNNLNVQ